jgi:hypothetical protein
LRILLMLFRIRGINTFHLLICHLHTSSHTVAMQRTTISADPVAECMPPLTFA